VKPTRLSYPSGNTPVSAHLDSNHTSRCSAVGDFDKVDVAVFTASIWLCEQDSVELVKAYGIVLCRDSPDGYRGLVADEYAVLVKALWSGQYRSVAPRDFRVCACILNSNKLSGKKLSFS